MYNKRRPHILNETYFWLTAGDENLASSRLRCFYLHREFLKLGIFSSCNVFKFVSVYVIQKRLDLKALIIAFLAKLFNAKLILDIDDVKLNDKDWEKRIQLFGNLVDAITTATEQQLNIIQKTLLPNQLNKITFYYFENPIDYENNANTNIPNFKSSDLTIGWFGNAGNFNLYNEFNKLHELGYNLLIIADNNPFKNSKLESLKFIKWDREKFNSQLINNIDICVLSHFGDELSESKSANKLIASIAIGVPVIASYTPAYSKIAKSFGIEDYLYADIDDLIIKVKKLTILNNRINYLSIRNTKILNEYNTHNIALSFNDFTKKLQKNSLPNFINYLKTFLYLLYFRYERLLTSKFIIRKNDFI